MRSRDGFTLIELMVVVLILGVLLLTAVPLYHTWRQRAYGTEAVLMMKQIMDGEIMYYLSNDEFYPSPSESAVEVYRDGTEKPVGALSSIKEALHVTIPKGHHFDYTIVTHTTAAKEKWCFVKIESSPPPGFPLFSNGDSFLYAMIDGQGKVQYLDPLGLFAKLAE
jgi:prepilin-type N-terminal cleavage/methylation domain-containing protein